MSYRNLVLSGKFWFASLREGGGCVGAVLRHSRGWKIPHPPDIEKTPYLFDIVEQYKGRPVNINDNRLIIDVFL